MNKKSLFPTSIVILILIIFIVINPEICKNSAINAILLCGRVIIPTLFPFTALILFIIRCGVTDYVSGLSRITKKLFGLNGEIFCIVIMSFLGGYPIGAKLLDEAVKDKKISPKNAGKVLNFSINAGPAFIIGTVGNAILGSKKLGYILLISHILSSIITMMFFKTNSKNYNYSKTKKNNISFADCFVVSVADASSTILNICSFVIIFSVIISYIEFFALTFSFFKYTTYFLEITTALLKTNNIYIISFLLGFSGVCIWCQIFSLSKNIKINILSFIFFRILHGILSGFFTFILLKICGITAPCISNSVIFSSKAFYSTPALSISLIIMGLLFLISIFSKKHTGKFLSDVI